MIRGAYREEAGELEGFQVKMELEEGVRVQSGRPENRREVFTT